MSASNTLCARNAWPAPARSFDAVAVYRPVCHERRFPAVRLPESPPSRSSEVRQTHGRTVAAASARPRAGGGSSRPGWLRSLRTCVPCRTKLGAWGKPEDRVCSGSGCANTLHGETRKPPCRRVPTSVTGASSSTHLQTGPGAAAHESIVAQMRAGWCARAGCAERAPRTPRNKCMAGPTPGSRAARRVAASDCHVQRGLPIFVLGLTIRSSTRALDRLSDSARAARALARNAARQACDRRALDSPWRHR